MVERSPLRALAVIRERAHRVFTRVVLGLLVAVVAIAPFGAQSATPPVDPATSAQLPYRFFDGNDGLPGNTVHAMALDSRSRLWIGTQDGLAMWNGREWHAVDLPHRGSRFVRAIASTADGALWIGTESGGLFRYDDGTWQSWRDELPTPRFNALSSSVDPDGRVELWGGNYGGGPGPACGRPRTTPSGRSPSGERTTVCRVWGSGAFTPSPAQGEPPCGSAPRTGWPASTPEPSDWSVATRCRVIPVNAFARTDGPGGTTLWASSWGGGLLSWDGTNWTRRSTVTGFPNDRLTSLVADPRSENLLLWAGTDGGGVIRYDGRTR
jgi:hypothetical protein